MSANQPTTAAAPRPKRRRSTRLQRKQTRLAWLMVAPALVVLALRRVLSARPDGLRQLHRPAVPRRSRADQVGRPAELPRPHPRHHLPGRGRRDGEVHRDHGLHRARARIDHRARRQLGLQGPRRDARGHARAVGDTDRRRRPDVEVDVRRRLRRRQRLSRPPPRHRPPGGVDLRSSRSRPSRRSTSGRRRRSSPCSCSQGFR